MSKSLREPLGRNLQERTESVTGCDSNESSKSLKPKRASGTKLKMSASSPSVRIEVKFQRPLTWKVSSASSSSVQIPIKKSLQSKESVRSVNVALNGDHIGVVQPPPGNDQPFIFDIPIQSCNFKRKRQRRRPGKPKRHDDSIYSGSNSKTHFSIINTLYKHYNDLISLVQRDYKIKFREGKLSFTLFEYIS